jgi:hypothetical protein
VGVEVILMRGDTLLAQTTSSPFGEFRLECKCQKGLHIYLDILGYRPIGIALPDPDE